MADLEAVERFVVGGDAGPESRDLDKHLRTVESEKLDITRCLEVLPHVVGDRDVDMPLEMGLTFTGSTYKYKKVE